MKKTICVILALLVTLGAVIFYFQDRFIAWKSDFPQPIYSVEVESNVMVKMSDGVHLSTDIYKPRGNGKFPVILARTPYGKKSALHLYETIARLFASQGYVFVMQDVRGKYESEGIFVPYIFEAKDGHETIEWAGQAEWSNGKVGMCGFSYLGACAWLAAGYNSSYLKTIVPLFTCQNVYSAWMDRGVPYLKDMLVWLARHSDKTQNDISFVEVDQVLKKFPASHLDELLTDKTLPIYQEYIHHLAPGEYWKAMGTDEGLRKIKIPVLFFAGWFDRMTPCAILEYQWMRTQMPAKLVIGPWVHVPTIKAGDISFGKESAFFVQLRTILEWFNYWLKDEGKLDFDSPVKYFEMGSNRWKESSDWPPNAVADKNYYFTMRGLQDSPDDSSGQMEYVYDPKEPVPSIGSSMIYGMGWEGPKEQSVISSRKDVVVFHSDPLKEDLLIAGDVKAILDVSSSAVDTDFCVKIVDKHADGKSYFLATGFVRMRYRNSIENPELIEPGKKYRLEIPLGYLGHAFLKGHSVQLLICSADYPNHCRHMNTALVPEEEIEGVVATQTLYFGGKDGSRLILPVSQR